MADSPDENLDSTPLAPSHFATAAIKNLQADPEQPASPDTTTAVEKTPTTEEEAAEAMQAITEALEATGQAITEALETTEKWDIKTETIPESTAQALLQSFSRRPTPTGDQTPINLSTLPPPSRNLIDAAEGLR